MLSLLNMLEFSSRDYLEFALQIGRILGTSGRGQPDVYLIGRAIEKLIGDADRLGLHVTRDHLATMLLEITSPDTASLSPDGMIQFTNVRLDTDRMRRHLEAAYISLRAELDAILFRVIAPEKTRYCDSEWLTDTKLFATSPDIVDELQRAGRCFAYGENTACVFHLMRVADSCFRRVSASIGTSYYWPLA